jgi:Ni/Co efflux regulator RcnB
MKTTYRCRWILALLLAAGPALAAPPSPADAGQARGDEAQHQRKAKSAVDDRADPRMRSDDVGKGTHFARKPLGPGAYFDDGNRAAVHKYYASHPFKGARKQWQIGQPLPKMAAVTQVPQPVLASLPKVPPGHRYVGVGGDILLIAAGSRMVVDGISAGQ